jgi:hypothetical protein
MGVMRDLDDRVPSIVRTLSLSTGIERRHASAPTKGRRLPRTSIAIPTKYNMRTTKF